MVFLALNNPKKIIGLVHEKELQSNGGSVWLTVSILFLTVLKLPFRELLWNPTRQKI